MSFFSIFKISRKTFLDPAAWLGYESFKQQSQSIYGTVRSLFIPARPLREESFADAMKRLKLTEADIDAQKQHYQFNAYLLAFLSLLIFLYGFFLLFRYTSFVGLLLGFAVSGIFLSQAFKYDFWALQLKERRLGLTFEDWKKAILGQKGTSHD